MIRIIVKNKEDKIISISEMDYFITKRGYINRNTCFWLDRTKKELKEDEEVIIKWIVKGDEE